MGNYEEMYLVEKPVEDCCKFIADNFDKIHPFEVTSGYGFQIRINEDTYKTIPEKYLSELRNNAEHSGSEYVSPEVSSRYLKDFFWMNTNEYVFYFFIKHALRVITKCSQCDAREGEIIFIDKKSLPEFILMNIGLSSRDKPKYPTSAQSEEK